MQRFGQTLDLAGTPRAPEDLTHEGFSSLPDGRSDILWEPIPTDCPRFRQRSDGMSQFERHDEYEPWSHPRGVVAVGEPSYVVQEIDQARIAWQGHATASMSAQSTYNVFGKLLGTPAQEHRAEDAVLVEGPNVEVEVSYLVIRVEQPDLDLKLRREPQLPSDT
jgi:hypothetical protein